MAASPRRLLPSAISDYKRENSDAVDRMVSLCRTGRKREARAAIQRADADARRLLAEIREERRRGVRSERKAHVAFWAAVARWQLAQAKRARRACR